MEDNEPRLGHEVKSWRQWTWS